MIVEKWRLKFRDRHSYDYILKSDGKVAENIVKRFKSQNPDLMRLKPEVGILQFTKDADGNKAKFFIIVVGHRYIFDYRLLPDYFEKYEVKSHLCDNMPKEFSYAYPGIISPSLFSIPKFAGMSRAIITIILVAIFVLVEWKGREGQYAISHFGIKWNRPIRYAMYYAIIIAIFWFGGKEQQFIYFQF